MSVLKFQQNEENCECPVCNLIESYSEYIQEADSVEELNDIIRELILEVEEANYIEGYKVGYTNGHKDGYKSALQADIDVKREILAEIEEDECDCECCDGDCELS